MNIQLKNLHASVKNSDMFFDTDIFINGRRAGSATYMSGASVSIEPFGREGEKLIEAAKEYCKTMPAIETKDEHNKPVKIKMDFDTYLINAALKYSNQKKEDRFSLEMEKAMKNAIIFGVPGGDEYRIFKLPADIDRIVKDPKTAVILMNFIQDNVLPKLKPREMILNTNFPGLFLKTLNISADKIVASKLEEKKDNGASQATGDEMSRENKRKR